MPNLRNQRIAKVVQMDGHKVLLNQRRVRNVYLVFIKTLPPVKHVQVGILPTRPMSSHSASNVKKERQVKLGLIIVKIVPLANIKKAAQLRVHASLVPNYTVL